MPTAIPISSTTSDVLGSTGSHCRGPRAARRGKHRGTGQQHRDTGRDQRAEHADSRMSVMGTEVSRPSEVWPTIALATRSVLASPASAMSRPGCGPGPRPPRAARARRLILVADAPVTVNVTRAHRPSAETRPLAGPSGDGCPGRVRQRGQRGHHLPGRAAHGRIVAKVARAALPGLDQHVLVRRGGETQPLRGLLGHAGLTSVVGRQVLRRQLVARHEDGGDEQEPAEDCGLAVLGTPPGDPFDHRRAGWGGCSRTGPVSGNTELTDWRIVAFSLWTVRASVGSPSPVS